MHTHLIDLDDFNQSQWDEIISLSEKILDNPHIYANSCNGKIMATLFYEPSTRTQMSFQSAMLRLGGRIIGFDNPSASSVSKGENLKDTTKIISNYSDIIVMRHNLEGSVKAAAMTSDCPIINAGDGSHLHPTQTLTDLLTLKKEKGRLENLVIGICGDLKFGRTVHSLVKALSKYNNKFVLISTPNLKLPEYIKNLIIQNGSEFSEITALEEVLPDLDVLYMTRIQKERFRNQQEYEEPANHYILDAKKMEKAKSDMIILHPLPRVNEIAIEVDDDPRALYFKQAKYGMYVRMALILVILNYNLETEPLIKGESIKNLKCQNLKCITYSEKYLPDYFIKTEQFYICEYCETIKNTTLPLKS